MKQILTAAFFLISISAFSQPKVFAPVKSDTPVKQDSAKVKHDTVTVKVFVMQVRDTTKVKFYYEDGDYLKIYQKGFAIRIIEKSSDNPTRGRVISTLYYDEKMRPFKYPIFNITER